MIRISGIFMANVWCLKHVKIFAFTHKIANTSSDFFQFPPSLSIIQLNPRVRVRILTCLSLCLTIVGDLTHLECCEGLVRLLVTASRVQGPSTASAASSTRPPSSARPALTWASRSLSWETWPGGDILLNSILVLFIGVNKTRSIK